MERKDHTPQFYPWLTSPWRLLQNIVLSKLHRAPRRRQFSSGMNRFCDWKKEPNTMCCQLPNLICEKKCPNAACRVGLIFFRFEQLTCYSFTVLTMPREEFMQQPVFKENWYFHFNFVPKKHHMTAVLLQKALKLKYYRQIKT